MAASELRPSHSMGLLEDMVLEAVEAEAAASVMALGWESFVLAATVEQVAVDMH